ncbi:hypothetical protein [Pseudomonas sp. MAG002Y]|uniref:hypothetical protein n=1 Tax=Pseudomonas sp. MAG002Y TaxID=2678690 RepID=UPI0035BC2084
MIISDIATIKTNFPDADFWLVRRGSIEQCGKPVRAFNPEHIGIKVERTELVLPDYLYYVFLHLNQIGSWRELATGTLSLVNIRVSDVKRIRLEFTQGR